jgi:hypothetical protein
MAKIGSRLDPEDPRCLGRIELLEQISIAPDARLGWIAWTFDLTPRRSTSNPVVCYNKAAMLAKTALDTGKSL